MPVYDYFCESNGRTVEVSHSLDADLSIWGEVCYVAQIALDDTDPMAPVQRVLTRAPGAAVKTFNAEYKNIGFSKLVKRDDGVYENVTAVDGEKRYMRAGDPSSMPHLHRKIED